MSAHTPGPWHVVEPTPDGTIALGEGALIMAGDVVVAEVVTPADVLDAELIAAAPDLLRKCEEVVAWLSRLAARSDQLAATWGDRFQAFADTCRADAQNYRATAGDIQRTIRAARTPIHESEVAAHGAKRNEERA